MSTEPPVTLVSAANAAVDRCINAYHKAYQGSIAKGEAEVLARMAATQAYRLALPRMDSTVEIRALIACVAHGLMFHIFVMNEPQQLLAAARVALATRKRSGTLKKKKTAA